MKKPNRFSTVTNLTLIILSMFTFSCSKDDDGESSPVITGLSEDIKNLIYFKGDEKAPKVLITIPGGPSTEFGTDIVDMITNTFNTTDILTATVHQAQTLNPDIVTVNDITLDQVVNFNAESIDNLAQVISYFKDEGRTVYVLGLSYGSLVTQEFIAKKGIDSADKYLIITGRLDINDIVWKGALEGSESFFENGITPTVAEPATSVTERNLNRLFGGLAMNRYNQLFNTIEDLSSITYVYGTLDQAFGSLTNEEVQFLESKNTNIISGVSNHDDTLEYFTINSIEDTFEIELLPHN